VRQYPENDVLDGALLLEYHPGQVEQHLVPLHLQLGLLVEVGVAEADAAELEVAGEHLLVLLGEGVVAYFIYHLRTKKSTYFKISLEEEVCRWSIPKQLTVGQD
jgi:hypothetical protein